MTGTTQPADLTLPFTVVGATWNSLEHQQYHFEVRWGDIDDGYHVRSYERSPGDVVWSAKRISHRNPSLFGASREDIARQIDADLARRLGAFLALSPEATAALAPIAALADRDAGGCEHVDGDMATMTPLRLLAPHFRAIRRIFAVAA